MAPWNWRIPCISVATDSDESTQTPPPTRQRSRNENFIGTIQVKSGRKSDRCAQANTGTDNKSNQNQKITATRSTTPVLFSTNRGLYLSVAKSMSKSCVSTDQSLHEGVTCPQSPTLDIADCTLAINNGFDLPSASTSVHEIRFCDLERWSTNRANTICLEDTFIVSRRNDNLPGSIELSVENNILTNKIQRNGSIFCVPSGSRHALVMPRRNLCQRSANIQNTFQRFGVR